MTEFEFNIFNTVQNLKEARQSELLAAKEHTSKKAQGSALEAQIGAREKHIIGMAYSEGKIEGGNAETRKAAEFKLVAEDAVLKEMSDKLQNQMQEQILAMDAYEQAKIERRYWEEMFSAQQAVLYARGAQVVNVTGPTD